MEQLTFNMAIALPNSITRSVCRTSGFVQTCIAESGNARAPFARDEPRRLPIMQWK